MIGDNRMRASWSVAIVVAVLGCSCGAAFAQATGEPGSDDLGLVASLHTETAGDQARVAVSSQADRETLVALSLSLDVTTVQLKEARTRQDDADRQVRTTERSIEQLESDIRSNESEIASLQSRLDRIPGEISTAESQEREARWRADRVEGRYREARREKEQAERFQQRTDQAHWAAVHAVEKAQNTPGQPNLASLIDARNAAYSANENAKRALQRANREYDEVAHRYEAARSDERAARQTINSLNSESVRASSRISRLTSDDVTMSATLSSQRLSLSGLRTDASTAAAEVSRLGTEKAKIEGQINALKARYLAAAQSLANASPEFKRLFGAPTALAWNSPVAAAEGPLVAGVTVRVAGELTNMTMEALENGVTSDFQGVVDQASAGVESSKAAKEKLETDLAGMEQRKKDLEGQLAQVTKQRETRQSLHDELLKAGQIQDKKARRDALMEIRVRRSAEVEPLMTRIDKKNLYEKEEKAVREKCLVPDIAQLSQQIASLESKIAAAAADMSAQNGAIGTARTAIKAAEQKLERAKAFQSDVRGADKTALRNAISSIGRLL